MNAPIKSLKSSEPPSKNLTLPEEAIKKITEAIKVDDIPSLKQNFDDLKNKVSETSETARLNAEIIGTDGKDPLQQKFIGWRP
ncbi:phage protein [Streptococcus pyogenes]|nr:phage protein [Streptococcus pyogenes]